MIVIEYQCDDCGRTLNVSRIGRDDCERMGGLLRLDKENSKPIVVGGITYQHPINLDLCMRCARERLMLSGVLK